eukprot:6175262-Pleurochrysis_carterae.AAC.2
MVAHDPELLSLDILLDLTLAFTQSLDPTHYSHSSFNPPSGFSPSCDPSPGVQVDSVSGSPFGALAAFEAHSRVQAVAPEKDEMQISQLLATIDPHGHGKASAHAPRA